jgi:2-dehydro-3-deoxyphosphooctonate aldolase (KDO 8-P synthase)
MESIPISNFRVGGTGPLVLIAGPCAIEDPVLTLEIAQELNQITRNLGIPLIFKASYDKANRTSVTSYRGIGTDHMNEGLKILSHIKEITGLPIITDVHEPNQAEPVSKIADVLQIPAFLCRQTDLILAAARTGHPLHIKKGQFMSPEAMAPSVDKARSVGNEQVMIGERGTSFGYNDLVVDFRSIPKLRKLRCPVVFDATHSVQQPGSAGDRTGGLREFVPYLSLAAVAVGVDALFWEVHPSPEKAKSDAATMLPLGDVPSLLKRVLELDNLARKGSAKNE